MTKTPQATKNPPRDDRQSSDEDLGEENSTPEDESSIEKETIAGEDDEYGDQMIILTTLIGSDILGFRLSSTIPMSDLATANLPKTMMAYSLL
jgi:hypothetical protein